MTNEKTATYTQEQTQQVIAAYQSGQTTEAIAQLVGKSRRSVIAKLAREGVYQAQAQPVRRLKKSELVQQIAQHLGIHETNLETLTKASHDALEDLLAALQAGALSTPVEPAAL